MFHGAQEFLLHRIINKMPPSFRRLVDNIEIVTRPKVRQSVPSIPYESIQPLDAGEGCRCTLRDFYCVCLM